MAGGQFYISRWREGLRLRKLLTGAHQIYCIGLVVSIEIFLECIVQQRQ